MIGPWTFAPPALPPEPALGTSPRESFDQVSLFSNIHYLFSLSINVNVPIEIRRRYPWILWRLWKGRNKFHFEGIGFEFLFTTKKILEDQEDSNMAQVVQIHDDMIDETATRKEIIKWQLPPRGCRN